MIVENSKDFRNRLINKQFEMIGENIKYEEIPSDGLLKIGKKTKYWYDWYFFRNEAQYKEWMKWAKEEIENIGGIDNIVERELLYLDLRYGLKYKFCNDSDY